MRKTEDIQIRTALEVGFPKVSQAKIEQTAKAEAEAGDAPMSTGASSSQAQKEEEETGEADDEEMEDVGDEGEEAIGRTGFAKQTWDGGGRALKTTEQAGDAHERNGVDGTFALEGDVRHMRNRRDQRRHTRD